MQPSFTCLQLNEPPQLRDSYSQDHAEHDEDVPQSDEDAEVPQTEQKLSNVVTCKTDSFICVKPL